jgi:hypothetical protein
MITDDNKSFVWSSAESGGRRKKNKSLTELFDIKTKKFLCRNKKQQNMKLQWGQQNLIHELSCSDRELVLLFCGCCNLLASGA